MVTTTPAVTITTARPPATTLPATTTVLTTTVPVTTVRPTTTAPTTTAAPTTTIAPTTTVATSTTILNNPGPTNHPRPFSPTSPWNTPTAQGTTWYDSVVIHQLPAPINGDSFRHWWVNTQSGAVYYATPTDPVWSFQMPNYIAPDWHRNRPAQTFQVHAPANIVTGEGDNMLVVVDGDTYYEVWNAVIDPVHHIVTNAASAPGWAVGSITTSPGAGTPTNNDGTRATNFSWAGGLITGHDLQTGVIDHALVLAVPNGMLHGQPWVAEYKWPATAWDNGAANSGPLWSGTRIGIPAGTPMPAGLSPLGKMMFTALQQYGAFVGDSCGGPWPMFYADRLSVQDTQVAPLFAFWDHQGSSDMEKIGPLLRVADYQPTS